MHKGTFEPFDRIIITRWANSGTGPPAQAGASINPSGPETQLRVGDAHPSTFAPSTTRKTQRKRKRGRVGLVTEVENGLEEKKLRRSKRIAGRSEAEAE